MRETSMVQVQDDNAVVASPRRRAKCPVCHCRETRVYSVRSEPVDDPDPQVMTHVLRYRYHLCRCSAHWQTAIEVVERTI